VFFRMPILIAQPRFTPRWLELAFAQDRVEGHDSKAGEPGDGAPEPERHSRKAVVHANDDDAPSPCVLRDVHKRGAWVGCMVQNPRRVHDVERRPLQRGPMQIAFDELHAVDAIAPGRVVSKAERRTRHIRSDDSAVRPREIQRQLTGAAPDFGNPGVGRNGAIEEPHEAAPLGPSAKDGKAVARRITGKGRLVVEAPHRLRPRVPGQPKIRDPVGRGKLPVARLAPPLGGQAGAARRTREQLPGAHHDVRRWRR